MNITLGNKGYSKKKIKYLEDSMFKSARHFANKYEEWTPETIKNRGEKIAEWALERWKH